mmetsp:Transcript_31072/g.99275  ORF Transcript_31072/g.99275 Transcript_31072/m.99275 type:complete len:207 (+) Transcript_31072:2069-2689(+)
MSPVVSQGWGRRAGREVARVRRGRGARDGAEGGRPRHGREGGGGTAGALLIHIHTERPRGCPHPARIVAAGLGCQAVAAAAVPAPAAAAPHAPGVVTPYHIRRQRNHGRTYRRPLRRRPLPPRSISLTSACNGGPSPHGRARRNSACCVAVGHVTRAPPPRPASLRCGSFRCGSRQVRWIRQPGRRRRMPPSLGRSPLPLWTYFGC